MELIKYVPLGQTRDRWAEQLSSLWIIAENLKPAEAIDRGL
ncbi:MULTISPECIES: hypothetical protein [unclassified Streptomyces]